MAEKSSNSHWWQSRRIQYIGELFLFFFGICLVSRLVFLYGFTDLDWSAEVRGSFLVGLKFDLRYCLLILLPVFLLAVIPRVNVVSSGAIRRLVRVYVAIMTTITGYFYIVDFGHYQYLGRRLDSTALRFLEDPLISATMVWQSYPVLALLAGLLMLVAASWYLAVFTERNLSRESANMNHWSQFFAVSLVVLFLFGGIHGRLNDINLHNPVPLRWNDALTSQNPAVNAMAINPILFLYDTYEQREIPWNDEGVSTYYDEVADYLGVTDQNDFNLDRKIAPQDHQLSFNETPNVIFIMLESLGASRLGSYGNPITPSPTPELDRIADAGWKFENFFVPVSGTARTVWASLTGLPDVLSIKTASRNPFIARQRVVLNSFTEHEKLYFIGGAAGWANMSAFITQSIPDIELYEEQHWDSPIVDVWGISDYDLFREVNSMLRKRQQPFFAYIQTAGNHRPFTIPENNGDFVARDDLSDEELSQAGFRSLAQFNAVRLLDYNVGYFLELAEKSGYLQNSIVVMFGDHNNRVTHTDGFMPPHFDALDLDGLHVPMLIYSPGHIEPAIRREPASLVDLVPTAAGLLGLDYENTTMGRDLNPVDETRSVYIQTSNKRFPTIGVINDQFALRMNRDGTEAKLHPLADPTANVASGHPGTFEVMKRTAHGVYEMTRYQMYANSPENQATGTSRVLENR